MSIPILTLHQARSKLSRYCDRKAPADLRHRVRLDIEQSGEALILIESRPDFRDAAHWRRLPVARFVFNPGSGAWSLYRPHLGNPDPWLAYPAQPQRDLDQLIRLLETDESGAFWG